MTKLKIDGLWEIFAAGGLVNPLEVIEQITYLMFIRDLDDTDNLWAKESAMPELSHENVFSSEIKIGGRKIDGQQLNGLHFMIFQQTRCIHFCKNGYLHL